MNSRYFGRKDIRRYGMVGEKSRLHSLTMEARNVCVKCLFSTVTCF